MAEKLVANQYADVPIEMIPQHPYAELFEGARFHHCTVCQLPKDHAVHQDRELVTA